MLHSYKYQVSSNSQIHLLTSRAYAYLLSYAYTCLFLQTHILTWASESFVLHVPHLVLLTKAPLETSCEVQEPISVSFCMSYILSSWQRHLSKLVCEVQEPISASSPLTVLAPDFGKNTYIIDVLRSMINVYM